MSLKVTHYARLTLVTATAISMGLLLSHQFIYKLFIVPRLEDWNSTPLLWQAIAFFPIIVAILYVGSRIRAVADLAMVTLVAASITELFVYFMVALREPGFRKASIELFPFITAQFFITVVVYAIFMTVIWFGATVIRRWMRRIAQAAP